MKRLGEKSSTEKFITFCLDHPILVASIASAGSFLLTITDLILDIAKNGLSYLADPMEAVIYVGYPAVCGFLLYVFLKTKQESITDELTQLYNARYLYVELEKTIRQSRVQNFPLSLLFIDIDNFKNYNDTYGHLAGDILLSKFGSTLTDCIRRNTDYAFRYGGDEFVIILAGADLDDAGMVAERVREAFINEDFEELTLSIGLAAFREEYTRECFLKKADAAMYLAKNSGKNKVHVYIA